MKSISKFVLAIMLTMPVIASVAWATQPASKPAAAETPNQSSDRSPSAGASQADDNAASMSEGEIRKVNRDAGKITIRHGPLKSLDMPPMTMVFRVKDPAMLDQVKPGDKVRFVAGKAGTQFMVMRMEVQK